jgi:hypothetical protein
MPHQRLGSNIQAATRAGNEPDAPNLQGQREDLGLAESEESPCRSALHRGPPLLDDTG